VSQFMLQGTRMKKDNVEDNVYWRGRIWASLNYWVYLGLTRTVENKCAIALA